jgi:hypothetical protein
MSEGKGKGGFRPLTRAIQDMGEIEVGVGVYGHLDAKEDTLVEMLLRGLRAFFAAAPQRLAELEQWEERWRAADRNADQSVLELRDLAAEASRLVEGAAPA